MTFLPIVERELRVQARWVWTYWLRAIFAFVMGCVTLQVYLILTARGTPGTAGGDAFAMLVMLALVGALASVFLTADCISRERRAGTLGLLFLADLRAMDIVLGKLAASGLRAAYLLISLLPVLAIPLMAGGVTGGEVGRFSLVLLNALFLSLALGLWTSARGREMVAVWREALIGILVLSLVPLVPGWLAGRPGIWAWPSPVAAFLWAADRNYAADASSYWGSLILVQLEGWLLLWFSGRSVAGAGWEELGSRAEETTTEEERWALYARRQVAVREAEGDPVRWLALRFPGQQGLIWGALALVVLGMTEGWLLHRLLGPRTTGLVGWRMGVNVIAFVGARLLAAWVACRVFLQWRQTGELELLYATPLGARDILRGQWGALVHLWRKPVIAIFLLQALQGLGIMTAPGGAAALPAIYWVSILLGSVNLVLDLVALTWVGMRFGLTARNTATALVWTLGLVVGLGWVASMIVWMFAGSVAGVRSYTLLHLVGLPLFNAGKSLFFIWWARKGLERRLRCRRLL